jgi:uncharacterized protein YfaS (alpha-2-macroglobulin family)
VTVVFYDANSQEIARAEHQSNDYGSFSGTFTAPQDRLTGLMRIESINPSGSTMFRVEEYKRPKFEVGLDAPTQSPQLNEQVHLSGKASSYTGAAIDGAKVAWRVERSGAHACVVLVVPFASIRSHRLGGKSQFRRW